MIGIWQVPSRGRITIITMDLRKVGLVPCRSDKRLKTILNVFRKCLGYYMFRIL